MNMRFGCMNKKECGASLAQYVIIITLIALALVPIYFTFGQQIVRGFTNFYNGVLSINNTLQANSPENLPAIKDGVVKGGQLGGTPDNPKKTCVSGVCAIDYGDFVLNGIPDNFTSFVESNGTAGGTDKLVALLNQLADQADDPATPADEGQSIRDLANLSHIIARIDEQTETIANNCKSNADPSNCFFSYVNANKITVSDLPADTATILPGFTGNNINLYGDGFYNQTSISVAKALKEGHTPNWGSFDANYFNDNKTKFPSLAAVEKFDSIQGDPKISANIKNATEQIYRSISGISDNLSVNVSKLFTYADLVTTTQVNAWPYSSSFDPVTGSQLSDFNLTGYENSKINDVLHPKSSTNTDIDSAIMCATGKDADTGQNCYNK